MYYTHAIAVKWRHFISEREEKSTSNKKLEEHTLLSDMWCFCFTYDNLIHKLINIQIFWINSRGNSNKLKEKQEEDCCQFWKKNSYDLKTDFVL